MCTRKFFTAAVATQAIATATAIPTSGYGYYYGGGYGYSNAYSEGGYYPPY
jgi:hypothetical protein